MGSTINWDTMSDFEVQWWKPVFNVSDRPKTDETVINWLDGYENQERRDRDNT